MIDWEAFYGSFRKPDFVPGYEIQNHLGGGAFGEVYKARKTSIGKPYAIKFLKLDQGSSQEAAERELAQVRLFASIDHPNLVTIEDMGVAMGVPYLVMGYAGEDTLARRLERGELDRATALRYFVQTCRGVLALHDRRLAHFDLKPGNVFLKGDVARVGDYGLARLLTEGRQTLSFGRGTPLYMAPEMLKNRGDHRSDVYSLGVMLYESLAGRLPFDAGSDGALVVRESDDPPEFPADFPSDVRPVVERCLRLDPADRYGSVHDLLADLGQTSRQGDSVRLCFGGLGGAAPRPPAPAPQAAPVPRPPSTTDDLRVAAHELARGAVGVARGVWDGVVDRVASGSSGSGRTRARDGASPPASSGGSDETGGVEPELDGDEVVQVQSLSEPDPPPAGAAGGDRRNGPRADVVVPRASGRGPDARPSGRVGSLSLAAPYGPGERGGTIPVPPRTEGGILGAVGAAVVLGGEILGALVTGPVVVALRATGAVVDRGVRRVPGLLGAGLRFGAFLLLLGLLGGMVAALVLLGIFLQS